jgi:hypothetical protein
MNAYILCIEATASSCTGTTSSPRSDSNSIFYTKLLVWLYFYTKENNPSPGSFLGVSIPDSSREPSFWLNPKLIFFQVTDAATQWNLIFTSCCEGSRLGALLPNIKLHG